MTVENFTIQYSAWQAVGCHLNDMAEPAQLPLQDRVLHGIAGCSVVDLYMCHFVPPVEAKNPLQIANVEGFKGFNVAMVHHTRPRLHIHTAV